MFGKTFTAHLTTADGQQHCVSARPGQSLMRAATSDGVEAIAADCGGSLTCATCHVVLAPEWADRVPPAGADELAMLELTAAPRQPNSRLSCQITMRAELDGLRADVPDRQY